MLKEKIVSSRMPDALVAELEAAAERRGQTRSATVCEAVEQMLEAENEEEPSHE